jgi:hypothetical protein
MLGIALLKLVPASDELGRRRIVAVVITAVAAWIIW